MKKKLFKEKDSFLTGTVIYTICIIITKILGIIYVIPFHAMINETQRILYSYAYNIYNKFLTVATIGIPLGMSKMISEYNSLNKKTESKATFKLALFITLIISMICTLILWIFSSDLALIVSGGSHQTQLATISDLFKIASTAIIFAAILNIIRYYFQSNGYMKISAISQVIEQIVRILMIIIGSYILIKCTNSQFVIPLAVFAATVAAIISLLYIVKNLNHIIIKSKIKFKEYKSLLKKIIKYTFPFLISSLLITVFSSIDTILLVKMLTKYANYDLQLSEFIFSVISTWGAKLNVIVSSITSGLIISLLPNITKSMIENDKLKIRNKINKVIQAVIFISLPMVIGLSLISTNVWTVFYGSNEMASNIFKISIFTALFSNIFVSFNTILQSINSYKTLYISLCLGIISKLIFNFLFIKIFNITFLPTYYASICATIISYLIMILIIMINLRNNFKVSYRKTIYIIKRIVFNVIVMTLCIILVKYYINFTTNSRIISAIGVIFYSILGTFIYLFLGYKEGIINEIFGKNVIFKIRNMSVKKIKNDK